VLTERLDGGNAAALEALPGLTTIDHRRESVRDTLNSRTRRIPADGFPGFDKQSALCIRTPNTPEIRFNEAALQG